MDMEKLVALCRRKGFIYQSSEIYGGIGGFWDYGPLGVELKKNVKDAWWQDMVRNPPLGPDGQEISMVGVDCSIIMNPQVWEASGHVAGFKDPMIDCKTEGCKGRFRADQIAGLACPLKPSKAPGQFEKCQLTEARKFNLMFRTFVGAAEDAASTAFLRPETAQGIFANFKNVLDSSRVKLPFGIAQIGKAFRNEINPRNFTFRSREFEQMELEYFCRPEQGMDLLAYWLKERIRFYEEIGISRKRLHVLDVPETERAFYSKGTFDIEYEFPFGRQELEGVAYRTDYDLQQHVKAGGKSLDYFDEETKERFIPHVVEPSAGVDRTVLALICDAYDEDTAPDEKGKMETRIVMRFHPRMAPIKCAIFPLLRNKEALVAKAREVQALLRPHMNVFYDEGGAIGRRYRRQDEIGTPFGVTIDFETLGEKGEELRDTGTLRDRDSMKQERVAIKDLAHLISSKIR